MIKIQSTQQLKSLVTITEYANLCNVSRSAIHLRIKGNKLSSIAVDPTSVKSAAEANGGFDTGDNSMKKTRGKLYRAVLDCISKQKELVMVDKVENPPMKKASGRPVNQKVKVGKPTQQAIAAAEEKGYVLIPKGHGYNLHPKGKPEKKEHHDNLTTVYSFLGDL